MVCDSIIKLKKHIYNKKKKKKKKKNIKKHKNDNLHGKTKKRNYAHKGKIIKGFNHNKILNKKLRKRIMCN